jgi:hypothetical protein
MISKTIELGSFSKREFNNFGPLSHVPINKSSISHSTTKSLLAF